MLEDSFSGVRGRAAGCVTVMVHPTSAQPTDEIRALYTCCCKDLLEVRDLLLAGLAVSI